MPLNLLIVRRALNGKRATYSIAKHPKLHLAADGKGGGSWRIKYRPRPGATQRWFTISNDARNIALEYVVRRATELLSNLSLNGVDPQSPRPNDEVTFDRTFTLWIERHGKVHKKSWREDEALYRRHIKARLGQQVIGTLTRLDVIAALDKIAVVATPIQANRCQSLISSVFSWALDEGYASAHPALRIRKRGAETSRDQVMDAKQLHAFWREIESTDVHLKRIIQLLLLLGCRLSEIVEAPVAEFQLTGKPCWLLPGARVKNNCNYVVSLPLWALAIIKDSLKETDGSGYLFPARFVDDSPFDKKFVSRRCKRIYRDVGAPLGSALAGYRQGVPVPGSSSSLLSFWS